MKQALVFGLAVAAHAMAADQADNELPVAPSGGKFSDFAKIPHRMGKMMFGDDELIAINNKKPFEESKHAILCRNSPNHPFCGGNYQIKKPFEESKMTEKYKEFLRNQRLQADDEELFVAPQGKLADLAKKYPGMIMFDEQADDELMVMNFPREHFKTEAEWKRYLMSRSEEAADDELIIAPTDEFGNIKQYPRNIRFDEADDELLIRPLQAADDDEFVAMLLPRDRFKTEEEYQKYVAKMRFSRDDAADDELLIRPIQAADDDEFIVMLLPREKFASEEEYQKYVAKMRFHRDDADNELLALNNKKPFEETKHGIFCKNRPNHPTCGGSYYQIKKTIEADDEFFVAPQGKLADLAKKYPGMIMFDEAADDELVAVNQPQKPQKKPFEESKHASLCRSYPDHPWCGGRKRPLVKPVEADDEELFSVIGYQRIQDIIHRDDEAADAELAVMLLPRSRFSSDEEYQKYYNRARFTLDDAADDELAVIPKAPRVFGDKDLYKSAKLPLSQAVVRGDDEGDDELVYLGSLIKHAEKITDVHTFDDDELRGEKSSHVKAQERNQFKSELPKLKKKLRPADETAFLA